jgi:hypothetical protein
LAIEQLEFARKYSLRLLDHVKEEDWFGQPPGGVSHIGWQVGHLAFAEYRIRRSGDRKQERIKGTLPVTELLGQRANSIWRHPERPSHQAASF